MHRRRVVLAVGASVLGQVVVALTPVIEKVLVDDTLVNRRRSATPLIILLVLAGIIAFAMACVRRAVGGRVALDVSYDLRTAVYDRLQRLDFAPTTGWTPDRSCPGHRVTWG